MLIVQLSDLHVTAAGHRYAEAVDTNTATRIAVARICDLAPAPDVLLLTGDVAADGRDEEYACAAAILAPLEGVPRLVLPGNHDAPDRLLRALPSTLGHEPGPRLHDAVSVVDGATIVALDTARPPSPHGVLDPAQLRWLETVLCRTRTPTVIALHHPPFLTGMSAMDDVGLRDGGEALSGIVSSRDDVLVVCGHVHRVIHTSIGAARAVSAPAAGFQTWLDFVDGSPARLSREDGGFLLHRLASGGCFTTHAVQTAVSGHQPYP